MIVRPRPDLRQPVFKKQPDGQMGLYGDDAQRRVRIEVRQSGDLIDLYLLPRKTALADAERHLRLAWQTHPGRYTLQVEGKGGERAVVDIEG